MGEAMAGGAVRTDRREVGDAPTEIIPRSPLQSVPETATAGPDRAAEPARPLETAEPVRPLEAAEPVRPLEAAEPVRPLEAAEPVRPLDAPWPAVAPLPMTDVVDGFDDGAFDIDVPLDGGPELPCDARTAPQHEEPAWNRPSGVSPITRAERRAAEAIAAARATRIEHATSRAGQLLWALTRVTFGFAFLWTFFDKLFGLAAPTPPMGAWRAGISPTSAYLESVDGPFVDLFGPLAGRAWVDWVFMISLAVVGVALVLGIGMAVAATTGTALLVLTWMAALPVAGNPVLDERLLAALVIVGITVSGAGLRYSLAPWWRGTALVRKAPVLR